MEAIGAAAAVVGLVSSVARVATTLTNLQQRYSYAALNIAFITSSLWTTKAALEAIGAWRATTSTDSSQSSQQLDVDLEVSLQAVALLVAVLERKLAEMNLDNPTFMDKARFLALDAIYKDFTSNLDAQIRALHLLLTIYQCKTATEQKAKLENQQTRTIIRQVQDSTASLRLEDQDLQDAASILSEEPSVNFSVDAILLNTPLYRKVYKKRSSYYYAQPAATPRPITRKPLGHTKSNSASSVSRNSADRAADPLLSENLQLPFLGIPFHGESSDPIIEENASVEKHWKDKETAVEKVEDAMVSAQRTLEPDISGGAPNSVRSPCQEIIDQEPSQGMEPVDMSATTQYKVQALEKKRVEYENIREERHRFEADLGKSNYQQVYEEKEWHKVASATRSRDFGVTAQPDPNVEAATETPSFSGSGQHASRVPITKPTSGLVNTLEDLRLYDSSSSSSSSPEVASVATSLAASASSARMAAPSNPAENEDNEPKPQSTQDIQEKELPAVPHLAGTSKQIIHRGSCNGLSKKSTISASTEREPPKPGHGRNKDNETFNINFGPSPSLDIGDLQPVNQTDKVGSTQMMPPDIRIDDTDEASISYRRADGSPPENLAKAGLPPPRRPPPSIPIFTSKPHVAVDSGNLNLESRVQNPREVGSFSDDDTEAGTTLSVPSPQSPSGALSRDTAASTPDALVPSTVESLGPRRSSSSLVQAGGSVRPAHLDPAVIKAEASRRFTKEAVSRSISALQRAYLSETSSSTSKPRKFPRLSSSMAKLSLSGHSKQSERSSAVYAAAATGNSANLMQLLKDNPKLVNTTTPQICSSGLVQPRTPLMCAAIGGHLDCIDVLRSFGADAEVSDKEGKTALHLAIEIGQLGAVTSLLRASMDARASGSRPPSTNETFDTDGPKLRQTTFQRGTPKTKLISINATASTEAKDNVGRTPLHYAVIEKKGNIITALIANGAVIDALDANKETPLTWAVKINDPNAVLTLLAAGADVKHRDLKGDSLLLHASRLGHLDMIELLSAHQVDLEARNNIGERPLHMACLHDRKTVVHALLGKGVEVNSWTEPPVSKPKMSFPRPARGQKRKLSLPIPGLAIHLACLHGNYDSCLVLIKHGAWVNATLEDTRTPLMLAVDSGNQDLVSLLLANGAKVNAATSKECLTALHFSVRNGDLETTKMLINHGANISAVARGAHPGIPPYHAFSTYGDNMPRELRPAADYVLGLNRGRMRLRVRDTTGSSRLPGDEESYSSGYGLSPMNDGFAAGHQQPPPSYSQAINTPANNSQYR